MHIYIYDTCTYVHKARRNSPGAPRMRTTAALRALSHSFLCWPSMFCTGCSCVCKLGYDAGAASYPHNINKLMMMCILDNMVPRLLPSVFAQHRAESHIHEDRT